jgi:hypothetical protein
VKHVIAPRCPGMQAGPIRRRGADGAQACGQGPCGVVNAWRPVMCTCRPHAAAGGGVRVVSRWSGQDRQVVRAVEKRAAGATARQASGFGGHAAVAGRIAVMRIAGAPDAIGDARCLGAPAGLR